MTDRYGAKMCVVHDALCVFDGQVENINGKNELGFRMAYLMGTPYPCVVLPKDADTSHLLLIPAVLLISPFVPEAVREQAGTLLTAALGKESQKETADYGPAKYFRELVEKNCLVLQAFLEEVGRLGLVTKQDDYFDYSLFMEISDIVLRMPAGLISEDVPEKIRDAAVQTVLKAAEIRGQIVLGSCTNLDDLIQDVQLLAQALFKFFSLL